MRGLFRHKAASSLVELPRSAKVVITLGVDLVTLSLVSAFIAILGTDGRIPSLPSWIFVAPLVSIVTLVVLGTYREVVRFTVMADVFIKIAVATVLGALFVRMVSAQLVQHPVDLKDSLLFAAAGGMLLSGLRIFAAALLRPGMPASANGARAIIYGVGSAATQLAVALKNGQRHRVIGFVDNKPGNRGRSLMGLPIYGPADLPELRRESAFDQILLAMPEIAGRQRRMLLEALTPLAAKILVIPNLDDLESSKLPVDSLREVRVEDLLSRESVAPNPYLLERHIKGRSVMVTGAGGSIGAELCRQAIGCGVQSLVALDHSEFALYSIQRELSAKARDAGCEITFVLGSVTDADLVRNVMRKHLVDSVYHAAAYKHVPLIEENVLAAVSNNIYGTLITARAAVESGVKTFILVSTDKAVRPTSVMGATKRVCELIVQALAMEQTRTCMSMVRFGNVLASSGSVIPLFNSQIASGGPVTVTHREATRYFMTISEAAQLVIQAGAMGSSGDVFVLDMGEPVKILSLAERMIKLSGLDVRSPENPEGDIVVDIIGLRPGEKLHEELLIGGALSPTIHPRILKASEKLLPWAILEVRLASLRDAIAAGNRDEATAVVHELARESHAADGKKEPVVPPASRQPHLELVTARNVR